MDQKMNSDLKFYVGRDGDISRFSPLVLQTRKQAQRCVQQLATNGKQSSQDSALSADSLGCVPSCSGAAPPGEVQMSAQLSGLYL